MQTITTTASIDAPPERVWEILTDFERHADWNPFFASVEGEPVQGARLKVIARKSDGGDGISFKPVVIEATLNRRLKWKGRFLLPRLFDGTHYFELERTADNTTVLTHGESFRGILVPLMGKVLRDTAEGFENFNAALAGRAEKQPCDLP